MWSVLKCVRFEMNAVHNAVHRNDHSLWRNSTVTVGNYALRDVFVHTVHMRPWTPLRSNDGECYTGLDIIAQLISNSRKRCLGAKSSILIVPFALLCISENTSILAFALIFFFLYGITSVSPTSPIALPALQHLCLSPLSSYFPPWTPFSLCHEYIEKYCYTSFSCKMWHFIPP